MSETNNFKRLYIFKMGFFDFDVFAFGFLLEAWNEQKGYSFDICEVHMMGFFIFRIE